MRKRGTWIAIVGLGLSAIRVLADAGEEVDVAPAAGVMTWDAGGKDQGLLWEDPRDIFRVAVAFADASNAPKPESLHLEYWQSEWPMNRFPREKPAGAGGEGWIEVGDWYNGKWVHADCKIDVSGSDLVFTFNPINAKEFPKLNDRNFKADYRHTLKLRLVGEAPLPKIARMQAYTDSVWQPLSFDVLWGGTAKESQTWDGHLEVFNGQVEKVETSGSDGSVVVGKDNSWKSTVQGKTEGIQAKIQYAVPKAYNTFDQTVVTVRAVKDTFSFAAADLVKAGHIFIPDFGVLVRKAGDETTYAAAEVIWKKNQTQDATKDLYSRVAGVPEQTFTRSWGETPAKQPHYIPISFEGSRQHFQLQETGDVSCYTQWIDKIRGKDTNRCHWSGNTITYRLGLPEVRPVDRHLIEGYLPIMTASWEKDGVRYTQTVLAVPLAGLPKAGERILADDPLVLMARIEIHPIAGNSGTAKLDFTTKHAGKDRLSFKEDFVLVADGKYLRMRLTSPDEAMTYQLTEKGNGLHYQAELTSAKPTRTLDIAIPFITLTAQNEFDQLRKLNFDEQLPAVSKYWQERVADGCRINTPETMINDFYSADVSHLLINTEREVGDSDRYMPRVGSFQYSVYNNESVMMLNDLEVRGYPKLVERCLDSWLHYQGTVELPGDFISKEGVLFGDGGYEATAYNQHHGWTLWMLGEHYWFTRDREWLERSAAKIAKGCDWVTQQRTHTNEVIDKIPLRHIERGLLPPGRLEDIGDWRTWISTNVYTWWGCQNAARALADINYPEAPRLLKDAEDYHQAILTAYTEAMRRSPVVPLRDGSWIPKVPSDVHRRGRCFGWITETLEGAIHLIRTGAIEPHDRLATWIIKDYEDNLYLSEQFGYNLTGEAFDRLWFSLGGVSMQANLLHNPYVYLMRDEPKHFLRAYFNAFSMSYFADTRMMTEHALPNVGDWRGDHFKSSDESNSTYWLRCMFVQERGDELLLGYAIPRYWLADGKEIGITNTLTHFGSMSMKLVSSVSKGQIEMDITPPTRNPPKIIRARFRHPAGLTMVRCEVDGKPYEQIDREKEWVELRDLKNAVRITAYYDTPAAAGSPK